MKRDKKTPPPVAAADDENTPPDAALPPDPIEHRPDGYYWVTPDRRQQFGPFDSYEEAQADMRSGDPDDLEPGESLYEAESEIGVGGWIDPDTGDLAEGQAPPHLED